MKKIILSRNKIIIISIIVFLSVVLIVGLAVGLTLSSYSTAITPLGAGAAAGDAPAGDAAASAAPAAAGDAAAGDAAAGRGTWIRKNMTTACDSMDLLCQPNTSQSEYDACMGYANC